MNEMIEAVKEAKPLLRTFMAFAIYLRFGGKIEECYNEAERFIGYLEIDVKDQSNDQS